MIHPHIADALKVPDLVRLTDQLVLLVLDEPTNHLVTFLP
ncbi:hypothetical protein GCM10010303_00670 [Streptomyces purpurascens]|nr:hypothetical protein GCM10010303_00670 [Streptomyces purpurascens]